jgi:Na+-driven multidrug efflux pump
MSGDDGSKPIVGTLLLIIGLFACCLLPLLLVGGGFVVMSLLVERQVWFALGAAVALALIIYSAYLRKRSRRTKESCRT